MTAQRANIRFCCQFGDSAAQILLALATQRAAVAFLQATPLILTVGRFRHSSALHQCEHSRASRRVSVYHLQGCARFPPLLRTCWDIHPSSFTG